MEYIDIVIKNKLGFHIRPAYRIAQLAHKYQSEIIIENCGKMANGKNIMEILSLLAHDGSRLRFIIKGEDEGDVFRELKRFLDGNF
jgi:phosphocarrier protein